MRNIFTDQEIGGGAVRLFGVLCTFDRGRGCWARRETIARMMGVSVSSVNHWVGALRRGGYVTVERHKDRPATIRVVPEARVAAGMFVPVARKEAGRPSSFSTGVAKADLQPVANTCTAVVVKEKQGETTTGHLQVPVLERPEPKPEPVVVSDPPENPLEEPDAEVMEMLTDVGVHPGAARSLACRFPARRIRAAVEYVAGSRGEVLNAPGYVRAVLEGRWKLPGWCRPACASHACLCVARRQADRRLAAAVVLQAVRVALGQTAESPYVGTRREALDFLRSPDLDFWVDMAGIKVEVAHQWRAKL